MARFVVLLILGAAGGAAAVWFAGGAGEGPAPMDAAIRPASVAIPEALTDASEVAVDADAGSRFAAERLAVYEQAAAIDNGFDLESLIRTEAGQPRSRLRDMRLEALLGRYAEIDPAAAFALTRTLYLETRFIVPVIEALAAVDADAAIDELLFVQPPARQRELALAVLGIVGNDAEGVERVAAALPESAHRIFEMDALVAKAHDDPMAALEAVLAMDSNVLQTYALNEIAKLAAARDPRGALALIERLDDRTIRSAALNAAISAWASADPVAVFAWLDSVDVARIPDSTLTLGVLARSDPERLAAMALGWSGDARTNGLRAALQVVADRDAESALAMLDTFPPSTSRDTLLSTIAQSYGRQNPDEALAWVEALVPPSETTRASVIRGIAQVDLDRALDVVVADLEAEGGGLNGLFSTTSFTLLTTLSTLAIVATDPERIVDRLGSVNNSTANSAAANAMTRWAQTDPAAALDWAIRNNARANSAVLTSLARQLAVSDRNLAMATMSQFPPAQQAGWLEGMVTGIAERDANEAMSLLGGFQGQPGYASAYGALANQMARSDPAGAARLLSDAPPGAGAEIRSAMSLVASSWSRSDPPAAAAWAATISDPAARDLGLGLAARSWAESDATAAREWALSLSQGSARDAALNGYLSGAAQRGELDPRLFDEFSDPRRAEQAAMSAIATLGRTNLEAAREMAATYITDPALRRSIDEQLARSGGSGNTRMMSSGGIVIVQ